MKSTDELIAENTKYFKFYEKAPTISTVILGALFFILSIILGLEFGIYVISFICIIIGTIVCSANYFVLKLAFSYIILHISYLKKIEENTKKTDNIVENTRKPNDIVENTEKTDINPI